MHILFLTDNFPPEVNAPASRTYEHCRVWVEAGHQVTVITCAPNFPKGEVHPGYKNRLWQEEILNGIRVIRVWTYITKNEGFARRIVDYLSYMVASFIAAIFVRKVDVIIGTSPQFFTVCSAYAVSLTKRKPWIFELRDIWPESIRAVNAMKHESVIKFFERVELYLYNKANIIVSVTHSFKDILVDRGVDPDKIFVITNGSNINLFSPIPKNNDLIRSLGSENCFIAGYIGTLGMAHGLHTLIDAAELLSRDDSSLNIRFLFLGDGAERIALRQKVETLEISNVIFVDSVSKEDVAQYWSILDIAIVHLKREPLFRSVIPSKIFEAMAMGIPILHGVEGESAEIVKNSGAGWTFEPENAEILADEIRRISADRTLREAASVRGPIAASRYDRTRLAHEMLDLIMQI